MTLENLQYSAGTVGVATGNCSGRSFASTIRGITFQHKSSSGSVDPASTSIPGGGTYIGYFYLSLDKIGVGTIPAGTWRIGVSITSGVNKLELDEIYICEVDGTGGTSYGTIASSTGIGQATKTSGNYIFDITQGSDYTVSDAGNNIVVLIAFTNSDKSSLSCDIDCSTTSAFISEPTKTSGFDGSELAITHFRWFEDRGTVQGAYPLSSEDTSHDPLYIGSSYRLRFQLAATQWMAPGYFDVDVEYRINSGSWQSLTAGIDWDDSGRDVVGVSSDNGGDGDATQELTADPDRMFLTDNNGWKDDSSTYSPGIWYHGHYAEFVVFIGLTDNDTTRELFDDDVVEFRVRWNSTLYATNTVTPSGVANDLPKFEIEHWRWRDDDDDEADATWLAAADTNIVRTADTVTRLRFAAEEMHGCWNPKKLVFYLFFRINGGSWTVFTTGTDPTPCLSLLTDGGDTTQQIGTNGSFISDNNGQRELTVYTQFLSYVYTLNSGVETEFSIDFDSGVFGDGDYIEFALRYGQPFSSTAVFNEPTIAAYPKVTIGTGGETIVTTLEAVSIAALDSSVTQARTIAATAESVSTTSFNTTVLQDQNVTATLEALTVAGLASTVSVSPKIHATLEALTVSSFNSTVLQDINVLVTTTGAVTTAKFAATVLQDQNILATVESVNLAAYSPTINLSRKIHATTGAVTAVSFAASALQDQNVDVTTTEAVSVASFAASISQDRTITTNLGSLAVNSLASTVAQSRTINATLEAVTVASSSAAVLQDQNVGVPTTEAIAVAPFAASIAQDKTITATKETVSVAPLASVVAQSRTIHTTVEALTVAAHATVINAETLVETTYGTVAIAGLNTNVETELGITTTLGTVSLTALDAAVRRNRTISTTLEAVAVAPFSATVNAATLVETTQGALIAAPLPSTIAVELFVDATLGTISCTKLDATVAISRNIFATLAAVTTSPLNSAVLQDRNLAATLGAVTVVGYSPNVYTESGIFVSLAQISVASHGTTVLQDQNISTTLEAVSISKLNATVARLLTVFANVEAVTISDFNAAVLQDQNISATAEAITVGAFGTAISVDKAITATLGAVAVAGYDATILEDQNIAATTGAVAVTGLQTAAGQGRTIQTTTGAIAVADFNSAVLQDRTISATVGTLAVASHNAAVLQDQNISASTGAVAASSLNTSILQGRTVTATAGAISVTDHNATILQDRTVMATAAAVAAASLNATTLQSEIVTATLGAVSVSGLNATVLQAEAIPTTAGAVVVGKFGSSVKRSLKIAAGIGALTVSGLASNVGQAAPTTVVATTGAISVASLAAKIPSDKIITATTGAVTAVGKTTNVAYATTIEATTGTLSAAAKLPFVYRGDPRPYAINFNGQELYQDPENATSIVAPMETRPIWTDLHGYTPPGFARAVEFFDDYVGQDCSLSSTIPSFIPSDGKIRIEVLFVSRRSSSAVHNDYFGFGSKHDTRNPEDSIGARWRAPVSYHGGAYEEAASFFENDGGGRTYDNYLTNPDIPPGQWGILRFQWDPNGGTYGQIWMEYRRLYDGYAAGLTATLSSPGPNNDELQEVFIDLGGTSGSADVFQIAQIWIGTDSDPWPDGEPVPNNYVYAETGAVTVTSSNAAISRTSTVSATTGTVTVAGLDSTIAQSSRVFAGIGAVETSGLAAIVLGNIPQDIFAGTGAATVASLKTHVIAPKIIEAARGTLTVNGFDARIARPQDVEAAVGAVAVVALNPTIAIHLWVRPGVGPIIVQALEAYIGGARFLEPNVGTVSVAPLDSAISHPITVQNVRATLGTVEAAPLPTHIAIPWPVPVTTGIVAVEPISPVVKRKDSILVPSTEAVTVAALNTHTGYTVAVEATTGMVEVSSYAAAVLRHYPVTILASSGVVVVHGLNLNVPRTVTVTLETVAISPAEANIVIGSLGVIGNTSIRLLRDDLEIELIKDGRTIEMV